MVHAAQYYPSLISVISHGLRFLPAFVQMKRHLEAGYVGAVNVCDVRVHCGSMIGSQFDWMCSHLMGGGILTMVGSHIIDAVSFVTGQRATRVHGMMRTFTKSTEKINGIRWIDSDDFCSFQMILDGGACVTSTLNSHVAGGFVQEVVVCGSRGRLAVRGASLYGQTHTDEREQLLHEGSADDLTHLANRNDNSSARVNSLLPQPYLQGLFRLVGALKEAFATGDGEHGWLKEPVSSAATFEDGQYVQAVIDAVKLSSASRQWEQVTVASDENELNPLMTRLNLPNINMSSLDALSQAPTNRPQPAPTQRKTTATSESHLPWSFATKH